MGNGEKSRMRQSTRRRKLTHDDPYTNLPLVPTIEARVPRTRLPVSKGGSVDREMPKSQFDALYVLHLDSRLGCFAAVTRPIWP